MIVFTVWGISNVVLGLDIKYTRKIVLSLLYNTPSSNDKWLLLFKIMVVNDLHMVNGFTPMDVIVDGIE